jgi:uncharacterized membrane protein YbhN (UPF0104 family)
MSWLRTSWRSRRVRSVVGWTVALGLLGAITWRLVQDWEQVREADVSLAPAPLLISVGLLAVYMVARAFLWHLLTLMLNTAIPVAQAVMAWMVSQLGKYLPGKVFLYAGRVLFYVREGRPAGPVTLAFTVELVGTFAASILTVLLALATGSLVDVGEYRWLFVGALVALLVVLHPRVLGAAVRLVARVLRRQPFPVPLTYPQSLAFIAVYVLTWGVFGVAFFFLVRSLYPIEPGSVVALAASFSFASMVGMLAIVVPSGLGVREGLLVVFLSTLMPVPVAILVSLIARVWFTAVELAAAGVSYLVGGRAARDVLSSATREGVGSGA